MAFSLNGSHLKHMFHACSFILWLLIFQALSGVIQFGTISIDYARPMSSIMNFERQRIFNAFDRYGLPFAIFLYFLRVISFLSLPVHFCNVLGLVLFNSFRTKVKAKNALPMQSPPFICFRVVTRGNFPELVKSNVLKNIETCKEAGLSSSHYLFEVVTDLPIGLPITNQQELIREIVVPKEYRTKTNAMYKARALQYCLEESINRLRDNDWIVHLDEETLMSTNSVIGILNFCEDGRHQFGQGVIFYARNEIVNWITTISDSLRVSDDLGKLRFMLKVVHKPLLNWKGSFVVAKAGAERHVSFDHGPEGSIAEDCYFGMVAVRDGYSFDFIEGEMDEKSPFTICDYIRQRARWFDGIRLTVHSSAIPFRAKFLLLIMFYAWLLLPITITQIIMFAAFPLPKSLWFDIPSALLGAVYPYLYLFGVVRSFSNRCKNTSWIWMPVYLASAFFVAPITLLMEIAGVIKGVFSWLTQRNPTQLKFYVVDKGISSFDKNSKKSPGGLKTIQNGQKENGEKRGKSKQLNNGEPRTMMDLPPEETHRSQSAPQIHLPEQSYKTSEISIDSIDQSVHRAMSPNGKIRHYGAINDAFESISLDEGK